MGLFDDLFGNDKKKSSQAFWLFSFLEEQAQKEQEDQELEDEMDTYCLEEWQKELVRKGEYDPCDFEEDGELEDDDYYSEDD